mmetsp:Transcript_7524/g.21983  ORF Transcript_7524/g.21983 Transcript_7524/m.21983 type:complete len:217 (-) Transcript_7524:188-838(-)
MSLRWSSFPWFCVGLGARMLVATRDFNRLPCCPCCSSVNCGMMGSGLEPPGVKAAASGFIPKDERGVNVPEYAELSKWTDLHRTSASIRRGCPNRGTSRYTSAMRMNTIEVDRMATMPMSENPASGASASIRGTFFTLLWTRSSTTVNATWSGPSDLYTKRKTQRRSSGTTRHMEYSRAPSKKTCHAPLVAFLVVVVFFLRTDFSSPSLCTPVVIF